MKCFTYQLNQNGESPIRKLPENSLTGRYIDGLYYGVAFIDDLSRLEDFNAQEITPLQFNQAFLTAPTEAVPNPRPALVDFEPQIRDKFAEKMRAIAAPYTPEERDTWFAQVSEANAYVANNSVSTPLLTSISTARGITEAELANTVITKDLEYRTAIGTVLGEQQALIDTIWKTS